MRQLIVALEERFRAYDPVQTVVTPRLGYSYDAPYNGLVEWMPVMETGETVTIKVVGYHAQNPFTFQVPTILSSLSVYDVKNGHLMAVMDGTLLTALRTGAASAVATGVLARPESSVIGIIGAGAQAVTQLHGLTAVLQNIETVYVFDCAPKALASFAERVAFLRLDIRPLPGEQLDKLVGMSDVLITATSNPVGADPVFADTTLNDWLHINAIGADFPGKVEVPKSVLERSIVIPDSIEQARVEGECQQLEEDAIGPSLYEVLQDSTIFNPYRGQLTVFDSTGWAVEDAVVSQLVLELAEEFQIGEELQLEHIPDDPLNPYAFKYK